MQKISQTKNQTVLQHPDGHKVIIAHNSLSPELQEQLNNMPMKYMAAGGDPDAPPKGEKHYPINERTSDVRAEDLPRSKSTGTSLTRSWKPPAPAPTLNPATWWANGGQVTEPQIELNDQVNDQTDSNDTSGLYFNKNQLENAQKGQIQLPLAPQSNALPSDTPQSSGQSLSSAIGFIPDPQDIEKESSTPTNMPIQRTPAQQMPAQQVSAQSQATPNMTGGLEQQRAGIQAQADLTGKLATQSADLYKQQVSNIANITAQAQHNQNQYAQESQQIVQDMQNGHINPNAYMENMSTAGRVSSAIGLILGGLSSGMTGKDNPAMAFLDKQIDRNIDAQKQDMHNKATLLGAMAQRYGNMQDALKMTRAVQLDALNTQLQQNAAKLGTPMAQAQAQIQSGPITQEIANIHQQVALRQAALQGVRNGDSDPSAAVQFLVPKEHQAKVFGEIEAAQNTNHMKQSIMSSFEDAAKENTIMRTGAGLIRTPGSVGALHQAMQPTFKDLEGTVRQAAMDNTFHNITPLPGDSEHKIQQKRQALQDYLQSKMSAPTAKGFGIDLTPMYQQQQPQMPQSMKHSGR